MPTIEANYRFVLPSFAGELTKTSCKASAWAKAVGASQAAAGAPLLATAGPVFPLEHRTARWPAFDGTKRDLSISLEQRPTWV